MTGAAEENNGSAQDSEEGPKAAVLAMSRCSIPPVMYIRPTTIAEPAGRSSVDTSASFKTWSRAVMSSQNREGREQCNPEEGVSVLGQAGEFALGAHGTSDGDHARRHHPNAKKHGIRNSGDV